MEPQSNPRPSSPLPRVSAGAAHAAAQQPERIAKALRKPVPSILMRNTGGARITVLHRRALNCLLAHAQMQDRLGIQPGDHGYEIGISDLETMLGFGSNGNRTYVVALLEELSAVNVRFDNDYLRGAFNLLGHVLYDKKAGVVTYSIDSIARAHVLRPERFAHLNIKLLQTFTSLAALMLFEYSSAFATSPGRRTPEFTWQDWSVLVSGAAVPHGTIREFNKILARAVAQVNANWPDYSIEPHLVKVGARLKSIWFSVSPKAQACLSLGSHAHAISGALRERLSSFGMGRQDIEALLVVHDEDYLIAQADYLARRMSRSDAPRVDNPSSFYRKAVLSNYANVSREPTVGTGPSRANTPTNFDSRSALPSREKWWQDRYSEARAAIQSMSGREHEALIERFRQQISESARPVAKSIEQHGLSKPIGLALVSRLLAHASHDEPSDSDSLAGPSSGRFTAPPARHADPAASSSLGCR